MMMRPLTDTSFAGNGIAGGLERDRDGFRDAPSLPPSLARLTQPGTGRTLCCYYRRYETHDFLIKIFTAALIGSVN